MNKRLEIILEICVRNELNFMDVMQIYAKANCRIYSQSIKKGESFKLYNPILEEKTMRLVERYFSIRAYKRLEKLKPTIV